MTELVIVPECDFPVDVGGSPGVVKVRRRMMDGTLREPNDTETENSRDSVALTEFELEVPPDIVGVLAALAEGQIPEGYETPWHWVTYRDGPGFYTGAFSIEGSMPALEWFPEAMQGVFQDLENSASDAARRVVSLIQWRVGKLSGSHNPVTLERFEWSIDSVGWFSVPCGVEIFEDERLGIVLSPTQVSDVQELAENQVDIPFAHVLLREAWELRTTNPRSSIVLGIAAAEVGIKQAIKILVPDADFLVEKLPLPHLGDLMKNYVPILPVKLRLDGAQPAIPKWVRKEITDGVEDRNKLAHRPFGGSEVIKSLEFPNVTRLLRAVQDLLSLLDFYCGYEWASDLLSGESRTELGLAAMPPSVTTFPANYASNRRSFEFFVPDNVTE